jgi:pyruvate dehydrogenase E2 component (dihydrolipoamide acetyltransferase)
LTDLTGSSPGGRIVKNDVLGLLKTEEITAQVETNQGETFTKMRQKIAERMLKSKQTVPHFYLFTEVDMTRVIKLRTDFNQTAQFKISVNDLIIKATSMTLAKFPRLNAHVKDDRIILKTSAK